MVCQFAAFCNNYVKRTIKLYTPSEAVLPPSLNNGHKVAWLACWELPLVPNVTFYCSVNTVHRYFLDPPELLLLEQLLLPFYTKSFQTHVVAKRLCPFSLSGDSI